ncbi:MAG: metallophosphoesterase family protein [Candidatus Krumholzibacteriota bacterium]|nr:metallophosphoesterase family protein [Candidatus Krumholzibacteriota bacterium]
MKYFIFSDIHANVEALQKVIGEISSRQPDLVVSLGDVVGYGADPVECVKLVNQHAHIKICGNHDLAAAGLVDTKNFNTTANLSINWTKQELGPEEIECLRNYDPIRRHDNCLFVHASPISPLAWDYIYTISQAERIFKIFNDKYIFIGHTHVPGVISYSEEKGCGIVTESEITVKPGSRYLVNTGSVGQPRDGVKEASFTVLDTVTETISMRRVSYDIRGAQTKILAQGLPESLALRLASAK